MLITSTITATTTNTSNAPEPLDSNRKVTASSVAASASCSPSNYSSGESPSSVECDGPESRVEAAAGDPSPSINQKESITEQTAASALGGLVQLSATDHEEDTQLKSLSNSTPNQEAQDASGNEADDLDEDDQLEASNKTPPIELRFLVRRREAGALIGRRGLNIKRLRETYSSSLFDVPDTGNGPERVVCVNTNESTCLQILSELTQLLLDKSPQIDGQIEVKMLVHSSQAGSLIGKGGQAINKLRNDSKAAIKIYELCCPFSSDRVCAIKARQPVVVNAIRMIQEILSENPVKGTVKPYDALHFDPSLAPKYGGYLADDEPLTIGGQHPSRGPNPMHFEQQQQQNFESSPFSRPMGFSAAKHYIARRPSPDFHHHPNPYQMAHESGLQAAADTLEAAYHQLHQSAAHSHLQPPPSMGPSNSTAPPQQPQRYYQPAQRLPRDCPMPPNPISHCPTDQQLMAANRTVMAAKMAAASAMAAAFRGGGGRYHPYAEAQHQPRAGFPFASGFGRPPAHLCGPAAGNNNHYYYQQYKQQSHYNGNSHYRSGHNQFPPISGPPTAYGSIRPPGTSQPPFRAPGAERPPTSGNCNHPAPGAVQPSGRHPKCPCAGVLPPSGRFVGQQLAAPASSQPIAAGSQSDPNSSCQEQQSMTQHANNEHNHGDNDGK